MSAEAFMQEAIRLAAIGAEQGDNGPFGAVIVRTGQIIGRGHNRVVFDCDPSAHAEIVAVRDACRRLGQFSLEGCELYSSCEPCPMCLSAAYWARIDRVYYAATRLDAADAGFDDALLYDEMTKPIAERRLPLQQLLGEAGKQPFRLWLGNPNRRLY